MTVEAALELIMEWDGKTEITNPTLKHIAQVYKNYMSGESIFDSIQWEEDEEYDWTIGKDTGLYKDFIIENQDKIDALRREYNRSDDDDVK